MKMAGLDIGSSATKICLFELGEKNQVRVLEEVSLDCPLSSPKENWSEHSLLPLEKNLVQLISHIPRAVPIGFTSAMHGLVLIDENGEALCDAVSWADGRSGAQAKEILSSYPELWTRTGTPIHPMAWPSKLLWFKEQTPSLWKKTSRFLDLKSYLLERLTGQRVGIDISSASGTGLWNQQSGSWDQELLSFLELSEEALPEVRKITTPISWQGRTLHLGAADGPLGNLGTGAVCPGRVAISLGTSGACRGFSNEKRMAAPGLFRYHIDDENWVEGGAISNGSSVLDWLKTQTEMGPEEALRHLPQTTPGNQKLLVYPYFQGERAPFWRAGVTSSIIGNYTDPLDLIRPTLEAVAFSLNRLLKLMPQATEPLRCTGGMFRSPIWCQLLADVTGLPVGISPITQATSLGAALLCAENYLEIAQNLALGEVFEPCLERHEIYRELYENWAQNDQQASAKP